MTIGQAVVWASQNIDPKHTNPELTTSEPYVMGSHATCSGAWASGPEDYAPAEYQWGYNRMMTVEGLFGAGDAIGGSAHKFSSGSFTEGRIAAKAAVITIQLLQARDGRTHQPVQLAFDANGVATLAALNRNLEAQSKRLRNPHPPDSLAWAAWIIGRIGGWDGYPSSKPPGPISMKSGLEYFHAVAAGWSLRDVCMP
jgi:succinate dehydrogenase/fumarate reductase flavoprotein subunit